jgi:sigma-B regulation protein RsbU (phosphoserine phosphatase)
MVRHTSERRMLVTLLSAYLDRGRRELILACAGHPPALRYSPASGELVELGLPAVPLGTRLPARFEQTSTPLAGGDVLLFYTDGLTELANPAGEQYGVQRLRRVLRASAAAGARDLRNAVLADLSYFKGDSLRLDDLTLVVVRVRGGDAMYR